MQATLTAPKPRAGRSNATRGVFETTITGRYTPVTVHQLAIVWWLYRSDHITRQQFRVYFAAQEMQERRRYTKAQETSEDGRRRPRKPSYTLDEIKDLIGSKGSETADKALSADVKKLGRLGLVKIGSRSIDFATSIEQIAVDDVASFWEFFAQLPNTRRTVPMPRRTARALAKGFTRGVSGLMIALLIRSLYWHRPGGKAGEQGGYRIDGRTKCSWVAEVFRLDRKTVSTARRRLIELGWLAPIECPQWELNKWGQRYTLNVHAFGPPPEPPEAPPEFMAPEMAAEVPPEVLGEVSGGLPGGGGFPRPSARLSGVFPSPCLNTSTSPNGEELKTRKPDHARSGYRSVGGWKKKGGRLPPPRITNFRGEDFGDTERMVELHRQAIEAGYPVKGEKGRLEFFALAERARRHGNDAPKLFAWLLREGRLEYITMADEDAAQTRIRSLQNPERKNRPKLPGGVGGSGGGVSREASHKAFLEKLGADERFVAACIATSRQHRLDPFRIARAQGWNRERWDRARMAYELAEKQRWLVDHVADGEAE